MLKRVGKINIKYIGIAFNKYLFEIGYKIFYYSQNQDIIFPICLLIIKLNLVNVIKETTSSNSYQDWIWIMSVSIAAAIILIVIITAFVLRH